MPKLPVGFTKRPDGRLEYRFSTSGSRHSVYGYSVKECQLKADEMRLKLTQGVKISADRITVEEYFAEWLENKKHTVKETTVMNNEYYFKTIRPYIGKIRLADLDRRDILHAQHEAAKRYSTAVTNDAIKLVHSLCKSAVIDRIIVHDPCLGVKSLQRREPQAAQTIHRALTVDEQKAFFAQAKEKDVYLYHFFAFLIQTGLRIGEASVLTWEDVDLDKNVIHITKTLTRTRKGYIAGTVPKTSRGVRDIPLNGGIKATLVAQRHKMIAAHGICAAAKDSRIFLPMQDPDRYLVNSTVHGSIQRVLDGTGIAPFSAHAFRDTFATRAIESGMPPNTLKEILGHASITMTMDLYAHVMDSEKQKSMSALTIDLAQ